MNHSTVLFCDDNARGLHFILKIADNEDIIKKIKHGGGRILQRVSDNSITFVSPDKNVDETEEMYSTQYIEDCCSVNRILDLKPYRLNKKKSKFPKDFDVMDVFLKYTTWNNALEGRSFERCLPSDSSSDVGDNDNYSGYNSSDCCDEHHRTTSNVSSRERRRSLFVNIPNSPISSLDADLEEQAINEKQASPYRAESESSEYDISVKDSDDESLTDKHNKKSVSSKLKTNVTSDGPSQQKSNQVKNREIYKAENKITKKTTPSATSTPIPDQTKRIKKKKVTESDSESSSDSDQIQIVTVVRKDSGNNKHNTKSVSSKLKRNVTLDVQSEDGYSEQKSSPVKNKGNKETDSLNNLNKASTSKATASDIRKQLLKKTINKPSAKMKNKESDESSESSDSDQVPNDTVVRNNSGNNKNQKKSVSSKLKTNMIYIQSDDSQQKSSRMKNKGNNATVSLNNENKVSTSKTTASDIRKQLHEKTIKKRSAKKKNKETDESSESSDSNESSSDSDQAQNETTVRKDSNNKHNTKSVSSKLKTNVTSDVQSEVCYLQRKSSPVKNKGNKETISLSNLNKASTSKTTASGIRKPLHEKIIKKHSAKMKNKESDESSESLDMSNNSANNKNQKKSVSSKLKTNVTSYIQSDDSLQKSSRVKNKGNNATASLNNENKVSTSKTTASDIRKQLHKKIIKKHSAKKKNKESDESSESSDSNESSSDSDQVQHETTVRNLKDKSNHGTKKGNNKAASHNNEIKINTRSATTSSFRIAMPVHEKTKNSDDSSSSDTISFDDRKPEHRIPKSKYVIPGRTWQSLKEHFSKQVIPRIHLYNLSENEVKMFRKPHFFIVSIPYMPFVTSTFFLWHYTVKRTLALRLCRQMSFQCKLILFRTFQPLI
ncbi:hypothetical protein C0J52_20262 [Blattella germanica]|nr:hypothetical protein C0J52_20262 [Blattella germanica]